MARKLMQLLAIVAVALPLTASADAAQDRVVADLLAGNRLFAQGVESGLPDIGPDRRAQLVAGQNPKAIVLSCSDSRVPPEHVFRQGLGDIFVARIAGNVPMSGMIASIEYAVEHLGTRVLMVMGHHSCGAVKAAVGQRTAPAELTPDLDKLVEEIMPAVEQAARRNPPDLLDASIHANARLAAQHLLDRSEVVRTAWLKKELKIVVAVYDLATGVVSLEKDLDLEAH